MLSRRAPLVVLWMTTAACTAPVGSPPGLATVLTRGNAVIRLDVEGHDSTGRSITPDTPMRVASITKSFTAAAVLTLVDEARVALDQPLVTYVADFRMADARAAAITVRHLLNQTSGLADYTVDIGATERAADLAAYVAALRPGALAATPGTRYAYCNVNYELAARLVEVVDGRPFAEAMRARVFAPLGMKDSAIGTRPADGYISLFGWWIARHELAGFRDPSRSVRDAPAMDLDADQRSHGDVGADDLFPRAADDHTCDRRARRPGHVPGATATGTSDVTAGWSLRPRDIWRCTRRRLPGVNQSASAVSCKFRPSPSVRGPYTISNTSLPGSAGNAACGSA
jgi:CubicO group peptidase (beta-lactamase class C family)